jgi:transcriptional regulator with XRE-family HTH domain
VDRGRANGLKILREFAREFRGARRSGGLSQEVVARASGVARATIGRLERDELRHLSIVHAAQLATAVGLDLFLRSYPAGRALRDAGQVRLLRRLMDRLGPDWSWTFEVLLGIPRDLRAWDARARHTKTGTMVVIEAVTRLTDVQEVLRRIASKQQDGGSPRVILLVGETRSNARALAEAGPIIESAFPVRGRAALRALTMGRDPGADALVVL